MVVDILLVDWVVEVVVLVLYSHLVVVVVGDTLHVHVVFPSFHVHSMDEYQVVVDGELVVVDHVVKMVVVGVLVVEVEEHHQKKMAPFHKHLDH